MNSHIPAQANAPQTAVVIALEIDGITRTLKYIAVSSIDFGIII
jgi:hypothetical protein